MDEIQKIVATIRKGESSGDYNAVGGDKEIGAYQIMPLNYASWAVEAGVDPNDKSPAAQDKIATNKITQYYNRYNKDPKAVSIAWNGGPGRANEYIRTGTFSDPTGLSPAGLPYDVTKYSEKFEKNFAAAGGQKQTSAQSNKKLDYSKFDIGVDSAREKGYSDTFILRSIAARDPKFQKAYDRVKKGYGTSAEIKDDKDLINYLSMKYTGKQPQVASNARQEKFMTQSDLDFYSKGKGAELEAEIQRKKDEEFERQKGESFLAEKSADIERVLEGYERGEYGVFEEAAMFGGEAISGVSELAFKGVSKIAKGLDKITGGVVSKVGKKAATAFLETEAGGNMKEAVLAGDAYWEAFKIKHPTAARRIVTAMQWAEIIPVEKVAVLLKKLAKPVVKTVGATTEKAGEKVISSTRKMAVKEAEKIVSPKVTEDVKNLAIVTERAKGQGKYEFDELTKESAEMAADYVKKTNTPVQNANSLIRGIDVKANKIGDTLKKTDINLPASARPNKESLIKSILEASKDVVDYAYKAEFEQYKDTIAKGMAEAVKGDGWFDYWKGRKDFDSYINTRLGGFSGSATLKNELAMKARKGFNEYIIKNAPDGNQYSDAMKELSGMHRAVNNIAEKVPIEYLGSTTLAAGANALMNVYRKAGGIGIAAGIGGLTAVSVPALAANPLTWMALGSYGLFSAGNRIVTSRMLRNVIGKSLKAGGKTLQSGEIAALTKMSEQLKKFEAEMIKRSKSIMAKIKKGKVPTDDEINIMVSAIDSKPALIKVVNEALEDTKQPEVKKALNRIKTKVVELTGEEEYAIKIEEAMDGLKKSDPGYKALKEELDFVRNGADEINVPEPSAKELAKIEKDAAKEFSGKDTVFESEGMETQFQSFKKLTRYLRNDKVEVLDEMGLKKLVKDKTALDISLYSQENTADEMLEIFKKRIADEKSGKVKKAKVGKPKKKELVEPNLEKPKTDIDRFNEVKNIEMTSLKKSPNYGDTDGQKRKKGVGFEYSAIKRKIEGIPTPKEMSIKRKYLEKNYKGKKVEVDGEKGTVEGTAFGKIRVNFNGTVKSVEVRDIKKVEVTAKEMLAALKKEGLNDLESRASIYE